VKILITGATGWLGQASLQAIKKVMPEVNSEDLYLYASRERTHVVPSFGKIQVHGLKSNIFLPKNIDLFIGLALKTRDYSFKIGEKEYLKSNMEIVARNLELVNATNPRDIILISSGVVSNYLEGKQALDPYTEIKLLEEKLFNEYAKQNNSRLIILRLWGATGELMTEPLKYAIGNLIFQAETSNKIIINSRNEVFRKYSDATQIFEVLLHALELNYSGTLNSGGTVVEIGLLAELIAKLYGKPIEIVRTLEKGISPDDYVPTDSKFNDLASKVGIDLLSLEDQIRLTVKSVNKARKK
jgi:nucleoside-diphosphate-sugar epimerase